MTKAEPTEHTMGHSLQPNPVDDLMERASIALAKTDYFAAITLCDKAMRKARRADDFDRVARIALPLQEARRQIRQQAMDASKTVHLITDPAQVPTKIKPGCYLVAPPLIGLDASTLAEMGLRKKVPVVAMAREPLTRAGLWPVVAVAAVSVRTRLAPPVPLERVETAMTKDEFKGNIPVPWFEAAYKTLGQAAIDTVPEGDPAAWRVDDLLERLDALPFHEQLYQALHTTARQAITEPTPDEPRRRPQINDPYSF
jgi:hypothetical protein